jgi:predicted hotdog family 3-hydroxylacyl-ACP dehydratase
LRPFSAAVVAVVVLMQAPYAHAQHSSAPAGPSEKAKLYDQLMGVLFAEAAAQLTCRHSTVADRRSDRASIQAAQNTFVRRWKISFAMK